MKATAIVTIATAIVTLAVAIVTVAIALVAIAIAIAANSIATAANSTAIAVNSIRPAAILMRTREAERVGTACGSGRVNLALGAPPESHLPARYRRRY